MSGKKKTSTTKKTPAPPTSAKVDGTPADAKPKGEAGAKAKTPRAPKPSKLPRAKRVSALDAAAKVLAGASKPLSAGDLIEQMEAKKLWTSPGGKTPAATLSAAIGREIKALGKDSRFRKADRGLFAAGKVVTS